LQWDYNMPATVGMNNYTSFIYDLGSANNFSTYDQMKLQMYRYAGNSTESLIYLKFYREGTTNFGDGNNVRAEAWMATPTCTTQPAGAWDLWLINLDNLVGFKGVGTKDSSVLTDIRYILIGCGSDNKNIHRTGRIDIDEIKMVRLPVCSTVNIADLNADCKVNFGDFAIFAEDWMLGVQ
jgi:hypothetical protein